MKEELIIFKTAKLAKEKGFNLRTKKSYDIETGIFKSDYVAETMDVVFAPTQSFLQKWLREKYEIFCEVMVGSPKCFSFIVLHNFEDMDGGSSSHSELYVDYSQDENSYSTYEEALERALFEGLNLI